MSKIVQHKFMTQKYVKSDTKQEFTDEETKRQYMKERQKKDNHNLSKSR